MGIVVFLSERKKRKRGCDGRRDSQGAYEGERDLLRPRRVNDVYGLVV